MIKTVKDELTCFSIILWYIKQEIKPPKESLPRKDQ